MAKAKAKAIPDPPPVLNKIIINLRKTGYSQFWIQGENLTVNSTFNIVAVDNFGIQYSWAFRVLDLIQRLNKSAALVFADPPSIANLRATKRKIDMLSVSSILLDVSITVTNADHTTFQLDNIGIILD